MAKAGLKANGRLKKGYRYKKGGGVVKVAAKSKRKAVKRRHVHKRKKGIFKTAENRWRRAVRTL
jgi:hypothetical protein